MKELDTSNIKASNILTMRIYLANLIACSIACILISLAYVAGVIIVGNSKGGELLTEANVVFMCLPARASEAAFDALYTP